MVNNYIIGVFVYNYRYFDCQNGILCIVISKQKERLGSQYEEKS
ncbi:hypothetical protein GGR21_001817 [Dysgonomonas hofstadii]|uniref:Uncharacterized protein n=1 Tax=Dysgonomonas hofstadii TaxID=637886 RepID=A0A840CTT3_9BACT|nr:hypothetical protein [Dysgonomonas hofstadii]